MRFDEVKYASAGTVQSNSADEQRKEHDVREDGREVSHFTRRCDPFDQDQADGQPWKEQAQHQLPVWNTHTIVDVETLLQHGVAVKQKIIKNLRGSHNQPPSFPTTQSKINKQIKSKFQIETRSWDFIKPIVLTRSRVNGV